MATFIKISPSGEVTISIEHNPRGGILLEDNSGFIIPETCAMADKKISDLTAAAALSGPELFVGVQGGGDVKITADQIKAFAGAIVDPITFTGDPTGLTYELQLATGRFGANAVSGLTFTSDVEFDAEEITTIDFGDVITFMSGVFGPVIDVATEVAFSSLQRVGGDFTPNLPAATTIDFSGLKEITGAFAPQMPAASSIAFAALTSVGSNFSPQGGADTSVDFAALATVGSNFQPSFALTGTPNFAALATVGGDFSATIVAATAVSFPALTSINGSLLPTFTAAAEVDFSALASLSGGLSGDFSAAATLALPALITLANGINSLTAPNLVHFSIGSTLKSVGGDVLITGAALDQTSVDDLLVLFASLDGTNGTTSYDGHTIDLSGGTSATPGVAGLAAKATLVGRGNTVTTN